MIKLVLKCLLSVVYACLIVSLSGLMSVAQATSCSDVVDPATGARYSQALGVFLYYNGKTYAISRSASTGVSTVPDGFFAMNAVFTLDYIYGGSDSGSLVELLRDGKYGAARPVSISDSTTQSFIIKNYGRYLGDASGQGGTYINVWKNYSSSTFTQINGSALASTFSNWSSGNAPAYTKTPQAVVMGKDGYWNATSTNGVKLSQVVEFDGQLDCALDLSTSGGTPGTPATPPVLPPNALPNVHCGADLDHSGVVGDSPGEMANCLTTPQGNFCPVGALDCNATYQPAICPTGSTLNTTRDMCQADAITSCPSTGLYQANVDLCYEDAYKGCPTGYNFVNADNQCEMPPQCATGTYNNVTNKCESSGNYLAVCAQGTLNSVTDKCDILVNEPITLQADRSAYCYYDYSQPACNAGYQLTSYTDPDSGQVNYSCQGCATPSTCWDGDGNPYSCNQYNCSDTVQYPYICDQIHTGCHFGEAAWGMSFNSSGGTGTFTNNACGDPANGIVKSAYVQYRCGGNIYTTYSGENKTATISCPTNDFLWIDGYYYTSSDGMTTCPAGTTPELNYAGWATQCIYTASNAGQGNPTCPSGGTLSGTTCNVLNQANPTCPGGTFQDNASGADYCFAPYNPVCNDPAYLVPVPGQPDSCQSAATHGCPAGTIWNGLPVAKCEAVPICNGAVYYDTTTHSCYMGMGCPYGNQYSCMQSGSGSTGYQCSPNACVDTTTAQDTGTPMDESYLQNDGQKDANGNCLGQMYIFSGKPSRCRPPGLTVGYINDCCNTNTQVISDDTGGAASTVVSNIGTIYNMAQVGYGSYLAATQGVEAAGTYASNTSAGVTAAIGAAEEVAANGASAVEAITAGLESFATDLIASPAFIIGVVVFVVMKVLMGSGCDQGDIQTDMSRDSKMCHYVGDFCYKKYALIGCVQPAKGYCCYNSELARIFAEQGRPQLATFGADGGWGAANSPNCRGFTPDEFQSIDFNKIDLTEYYSVIENNITQKLNAAQQNITTTIQNRVNADTGH